MSKLHQIYDNTRAIKETAGLATQRINAASSVAPIKNLRVGKLLLGKIAYNLNGYAPGKVEELKGTTVTIRGTFHRASEWKSTPWTDAEKKSYFSNHSNESARERREVKETLHIFDKTTIARRELMKEFCK